MNYFCFFLGKKMTVNNLKNVLSGYTHQREISPSYTNIQKPRVAEQPFLLDVWLWAS